ncbi:Uncharacterised protein [uncultured archaeon]|nr:Uncharacterised protein [uncultured archaeon]
MKKWAYLLCLLLIGDLLLFPAGEPSSLARLASVILLLGIPLGLGSAILSSYKSDFWSAGERIFLEIGVGLASFPFLAFIFELLGIPHRWYIYITVCWLIPFITYAQRTRLKRPAKKLSEDKAPFYGCLAVALALLMLFTLGAFNQWFLEDGDSWQHAAGAYYVRETGSYTPPSGVYVSHYLMPYPPFYDTLIGVAAQPNPSISWTLKAGNALIAALGVAFAYLLAYRLSKNRTLAFYASLLTACLPGYQTHAIWAHTYALTALYPALTMLAEAHINRKTMMASALPAAGALLIQPFLAIINAFTIILFAAIPEKKTNRRRTIAAATVGIILGLTFWVYLMGTYGWELPAIDNAGKQFVTGNYTIQGKENTYSLYELAIAKPQGNIYLHTGFGTTYFLLLLISLPTAAYTTLKRKDTPAFKEKASTQNTTLTLTWLTLTAIALMSYGHPATTLAPRMWGAIAFPAAYIAAYGLAFIDYTARHEAAGGRIIVGLICAGVLLTSAWPKAVVQTDGQWPTDLSLYGVSGNYQVLSGLPKGSSVLPVCLPAAYVVGMDLSVASWENKTAELIQLLKTKPPDAVEISRVMKEAGYDFILCDSSCTALCKSNSDVCKPLYDLKTRLGEPQFVIYAQNADVTLYKVI